MTLNRAAFGRLAALSACGLALAPLRALADVGQATVYVGFPPGGLPDAVARAVAEQLRHGYASSAVVENRPGADGRLAVQAVKNAAPDGSTLLVAPAAAIVFLPHVYNNLGYDPLVDLVPVAQLVQNDFAIAINPKIPAKTFKEFAAWCKANPDRATVGTSGAGSAPDFMSVLIGRAMNTKFVDVPYRGAAAALTDVIGGQLAAVIATTPALIPQHEAGAVRILATTGPGRALGLAEVPTFRELGFADLTITDAIWVLAPGKTPAAKVAVLSAAVLDTLKLKTMDTLMKTDFLKPAPIAAAELGKVARDEYARWGSAIKAAGYTVG